MGKPKTKKKINKGQRISFARMCDIRGVKTKVKYFYYPSARKLFAVANGRVKVSYAGAIATNIYNRLSNEGNIAEARKA